MWDNLLVFETVDWYIVVQKSFFLPQRRRDAEGIIKQESGARSQKKVKKLISWLLIPVSCLFLSFLCASASLREIIPPTLRWKKLIWIAIFNHRSIAYQSVIICPLYAFSFQRNHSLPPFFFVISSGARNLKSLI